MSVSIKTNIFSLRAQRYLSESTNRLGNSNERLSSGMRINKASDDAAGLAISSALDANIRISGQAYRNANDGISVLNIANGALEAFSSILIRQKELAEQAANQTYSQKQRLALQKESDALSEEFNRIAATTTFNDKALFNLSDGGLSIQLGSGLENYLALSVGQQLNRNIFDNSFATSSSYSAFSGNETREAFGDVTGDGIIDFVYFDSSNLNICIGNGDGTFNEPIASSAGPLTLSSLQIVDLNNDGKNDIIGKAGTTVRTYLGRGDGTFQTGVSFSTLNTSNLTAIGTGDFNGDGKIDVITNFSGGKATGESINVLYGNGNGTLQAGVRFTTTSNFIGGFQIADFNNDGYSDVIGYASSPNIGIVYLGSQNGISATGLQTNIPTTTNSIAADFDRDGYIDIVDSAVGRFFGGNGDGTFKSVQNIAAMGATARSADLNADGYEDIYTFNGTNLTAIFGNGDGTFGASISYAFNISPGSTSILKDLNGDGVLDVAGTGTNNFSVSLANTVKSASVQHLNIASAGQARSSLDIIEVSLKRVRGEIGNIGAAQSRLFSAATTLSTSKNEFQASYSRIMDTDIANELSILNSSKILQQTATAIMAQANFQPEIAIKLLGNNNKKRGINFLIEE